MGGHAHASRKRGVRASRLKLYQALTDAGLKTQVALAVRIADLEGLDEVPRDLVNRVFREQPVEMASLERVARGLGVQAYTLYKTADDQDREFANADRKSVVEGKSVSVRVDLGGCRNIKKKIKQRIIEEKNNK